MGRNLNIVSTLHSNHYMELHVKKVKFGVVEKNIYCEERSSALRFVVQVSPLPKVSATVALGQFEQGLAWARQKPEQFDALVSLTYNAGARGSRGTYKLIEKGDFKGAAANIRQMTRTTIKGKKSCGSWAYLSSR
ncbi:MAG: hypothetical protein JWQ80_1407 [Massilia sp.]|nr:hypothetical protein [Massilia sp.]